MGPLKLNKIITKYSCETYQILRVPVVVGYHKKKIKPAKLGNAMLDN